MVFALIVIVIVIWFDFSALTELQSRQRLVEVFMLKKMCRIFTAGLIFKEKCKLKFVYKQKNIKNVLKK